VRDVVRGVFASIVDDDNVLCSEKLRQLTFHADYPDSKGSMTCLDDSIMGETRDEYSDNPTVILCPPAFKHGAINDPGTIIPDDSIQAVTCANIGDRVTWRMDTVGSIILHEYT
jgi:hypothetical protein